MISMKGDGASGAEFLKMLMGQQQPEEPKIKPEYDPKAIREATGDAHKLAMTHRALFYGKIVPILFLLGLIGTIWSPAGFLTVITSTLIVMAASANILVNFFDMYYLRSNEARGDYTRMANMVFAKGSYYWKYRDFENDLTSAYPVIIVITLALGSLFLLGWYFTMAMVTAAFFTDAMASDLYNRKGKSLIIYKDQWDVTVGKREAEAAAERQRAEDFIRSVEEEAAAREAEEYSPEELLDNPLAADEPEPNTKDVHGSFYRDPNDHADVKYEGDDEDGDSHIRGG